MSEKKRKKRKLFSQYPEFLQRFLYDAIIVAVVLWLYGTAKAIYDGTFHPVTEFFDGVRGVMLLLGIGT